MAVWDSHNECGVRPTSRENIPLTKVLGRWGRLCKYRNEVLRLMGITKILQDDTKYLDVDDADLRMLDAFIVDCFQRGEAAIDAACKFKDDSTQLRNHNGASV